MRILVICKANFEPTELNFQKNRSYIYDQVQGLKKKGLDVKVFFLKGKGVSSYFSGAFKLKKHLRNNRYDIVHAHYGFTGFIAGLVCPYKKVVTYHGTDIYEKTGNIISFFSIIMSDWNIFVSRKLYNRTIFRPKTNFSIFPCGVDLNVFFPVDKLDACKKLGLNPDRKRIVFASSFSNPIKNFPLAKKAIQLTGIPDIDLIELKNKTREEVSYILNASDLLLITSHFEGSSQIAKEALACNCPIISTDVGDIKEFIGESLNSFVCSFDPVEISEKISLIINTGNRGTGRCNIVYLNSNSIIEKTIETYSEVLKK